MGSDQRDATPWETDAEGVATLTPVMAYRIEIAHASLIAMRLDLGPQGGPPSQEAPASLQLTVSPRLALMLSQELGVRALALLEEEAPPGRPTN